MQASNSQQFGADGVTKPEDEAPWYMKYGVKVLGTIGGGLALLLGAISVIGSLLTISPVCLILSIWQMVLGAIVIMIESPCCVFVTQLNKITAIIDSKPLIFKAGFYIVGPLPVLLFCFGLNQVFANIGIIGTGVVYAMMALGKKADRSEMARNAQAHTPYTGSAQPPQPSGVTIIKRDANPPPKPPPPSYSDSYAAPYTHEPPKAPAFTGSVGWDTSYLQSSTTDLHAPYNSDNTKTPEAPASNPFQ